ncbi:MAG TPA: insulinase family protein [Desulfobacterales bacterium]|nr:insulinase family protein [Desulfobacterales bacterium]
MNPIFDASNPGLQAGDELHGYRVRRVEHLAVIHSVCYELDHPATGAKHLHVSRPDSENAFGVIFRTVPQDSTGVAHILEHTVLCGSQRYPVRDPFFSMLKRSLSTFMNAFTASDWTMYPFSTQNRKDFYNLLDVYLDAAFFPRLEEVSFKQEGHRLEIDGDDPEASPLVYKGVVYNEMKGAMSAPDQIMVRSMMKALYPDTTYANNSGGEPAAIPSLTYAQLTEFHRRHYHPSNSFFYTYGDLPLSGHLEIIGRNVLARFQAVDPATGVPPQPRWSAPRSAGFPYPFTRGEDATQKHQVSLAWLTTDIRDTREVLALSLLEQILLGNAASPLRKALIDSGLGSALSDGSGYDAENRDTLFAAGLKDVALASAERIEAIMVDVLTGLAERGIDPELVESAIHQLEFHRREITNSPYPYGIKLLLGLTGTWIHDGDPLRVLKFDADLADIRRQVEQGGFFERQLRRYLLENPHRVRLTLSPDPEMAEREEQRVRQELLRRRQGLTPADLATLRRDADVLRRLQESAENVTCLPTLERQDIPPDVPVVAAHSAEAGGRVVTYAQATSGIVYIAAAAGSGNLPPELSDLAPFFCHAFSRIGTALRDYSEMARRIDAVTGGVGLAVQPRTGFDGAGDCIPFVALNAKSLRRNLDPMADILAELLGRYDFSDRGRLKNLLLEYRSGLESAVVHNGHRLAMSMAARHFSAASALSEAWSGVHQLLAVKRLTEDLSEERLTDVAARLDDIGKRVFSRDNFRMAVIGETDVLSAGRAQVAELTAALSGAAGAGFTQPPAAVSGTKIREGWSTATAVNFVAAAFPAVRLEHADSPALAVIAKMLRSLYLHREIREKGGAYGGFAAYNSEDGVFSFASYRDPRIAATLDVFQGAGDFIGSGKFDDTDVKEAVLQVCAEIDKPDPPGPAARKAFYREIIGLSDELRRRFKRRLIGLTRSEVREVAERTLGAGLADCSVAVVGSEESLREANTQLAEPLEMHKI